MTVLLITARPVGDRIALEVLQDLCEQLAAVRGGEVGDHGRQQIKSALDIVREHGRLRVENPALDDAITAALEELGAALTQPGTRASGGRT